MPSLAMLVLGLCTLVLLDTLREWEPLGREYYCSEGDERDNIWLSVTAISQMSQQAVDWKTL